MDNGIIKRKKEPPFFQVANDIFDLDLPLNIYQKIVYIYLVRCSNQGADAFPSYNTIANKCGMSRRKAIDTIEDLIKLKLLEKHIRTNGKSENISNLYVIDEPSACCALPSEQCAPPSSECDAPPSEQCAPKKELYKKNHNKKEPLKVVGGNFNNFEQRDYDFEDLEKKLLGWE